MKPIEQELYAVGDEVALKADFHGEPDDIGIVSEVDTTYGHGYYYVDYTDQSGRSMRCGCGNKHIRGRLPRVEKLINPAPSNIIEGQCKRLVIDA